MLICVILRRFFHRNSQLSMEGISAFGTSASVTQTSQGEL